MAGTAPGYAPGEMTLSRTGDKVYMCSVYDLTEQVGHSLTGKHPTGVFSDSVRSRTGDKVRNPPAGEMKLSLKPFSKGLRSLEAEPQVALRRARNSPFDSGLLTGINQNKKIIARRSERNTPRPLAAHGKDRPKGRSFLFCMFELIPGSGTGNQRGDSGLCGVRLRALP